ncbi:hypothetical protein LWC35_31285 [Pseudonocardia kujensis]|uniref:hypothetical protein n=1 Tax=Pseudonocardia kujensis TaxID=1128675 RepID=UPI001E34658A|nr:hypothetical protein [Pseudonocardia kujensis]MCE0767355.1 hypothetical protein [Pseudonocardia kujensis]
MTRRRNGWGEVLDPWRQLAEIAWSAPQVVAHRTARMARGGWPPGPRDRREYRRMVAEKGTAFTRAAVASAWAVPRAASLVLTAGLTPVHRTVTANRRRLSR